MIAEFVTSMGLLAAGAVAAMKLRQRREWQRRRTQLRSLAVEHGMKLLGVEEHDFMELEDLDERGQDVGCELVGIMEGHDAAGEFALGYRFVSGIGQHFLQFDLATEDLPEGLHVQPDIGRGHESWWLRTRRRARKEARKPRGARLQLQWTADPEALRSERRLATAMRWIDEIARGAAASSALRVGLTVQRAKITLYSPNALSDSALASFYERGMRLRRLMTQGVGASPARRTVKTSTSNADLRAAVRRAEAATRPVEPVPADEQQTKVIDITVQELLREQPVASAKKKEFEVPEPEEEVRVLSAR